MPFVRDHTAAVLFDVLVISWVLDSVRCVLFWCACVCVMNIIVFVGVLLG